MATVNYAPSAVPGYLENATAILWETLTTTNDTGQALQMGGSTIRSVQITGTFGAGGTVVLEGSNDGTNYVTLTDPQGNALSKTAAGIEAIQEITRYIRPRVTAGDGTTDLDVTMLVVRRGN